MLNELDVVRLKRNLPEFNLTEGSIGAVVIVHSNPPAFEVEFCDDLGKTVAMVFLEESDLDKVE